jgi:Contractile injection system tube protein/LysM domain
MERLSHARLVAHWQKGDEIIEFKINPTELTFDKGVQIAEIAIPGLDSPLLQFVRGHNEKLSLDLFFDTTEDGMGVNATSVTTLTDRVYGLLKSEPDRHAPPVCTFYWNANFPGAHISAKAGGNQRRTSFACILESVKQKFTLFSPQGVPLRATLTVSLREYKIFDVQPYQQNPSSPNRTHISTITRHETLSGIAGLFYGRPGEWRAIADANNINDPRRISAGMTVVVPPIE